MKQSVSSMKSSLSSTNSKSKKNSKEREKRKSQGSASEVNNHNFVEKGSPTKDSNNRQYAGLDNESLAIYAEQNGFNHLSEKVSDTLTEDINYRLRYVINDALLKARLSGRNAITSADLEQTFENLNIDRVYGAPSCPQWVPLENQNLFFVDDTEVNLLEIVKKENVYEQPGDTIFTKRWIPEQKEVSKALKNYFTTVCQMVVSKDVEERSIALKDIQENPRIGPIVDWFYNFSFTLLSKDVTYDCLTLNALELIRVLETSTICRLNAPEKQLKLLVRLIMQRLLISISTAVLAPMCSVLAILCRRPPLREFVISKVLQKLEGLHPNCTLSILSIANSLGSEAVRDVFLANMEFFFVRMQKRDPNILYAALETYNILCRSEFFSAAIYDIFHDLFGDVLALFQPPPHVERRKPAKEGNFVHTKSKLILSRRKVLRSPMQRETFPRPIEEVFEMPPENSKLRRKLDNHIWENSGFRTKSEFADTVGKTSLLLPVLKDRKCKVYSSCHSLLCYNV